MNNISENPIPDIISYRLSRANETIEEAKLLLNNNRYNAAVNRLYYACYYAVNALLIKNGIITKTHEGAKAKLGQHFISTGILDKNSGRHYSQLSNARITGDYDDFVQFNRTDVIDFLFQSEKFIESITNLI